MDKNEEKEYFEWLNLGITRKWISEPFCYTHDGDPYMSITDQQELEDGGDPCSPVLKLLQE